MKPRFLIKNGYYIVPSPYTALENSIMGWHDIWSSILFHKIRAVVMFSNPRGRRFKTSCENTNAFSTGCSLSDQHILLPINHSIYEDVWQFTQIVLKFKTAHLFLTICVNFHKSDENQSPYFGLIGDSNSKDLLETKSTKVFSVFCYINLFSWNLLFIWFLPSHETFKTQ